jgi:hypothetical protein
MSISRKISRLYFLMVIRGGMEIAAAAIFATIFFASLRMPRHICRVAVFARVVSII